MGTEHGPAQPSTRTVGIMTMQRIQNYGSTLQAYGLKRLVESTVPGATVSFLDFRPGHVLAPTGAVPVSRLGRNLAKLREYNRTETSIGNRVKFFNHKRTYGRRFFPLIGLPAEPVHERSVDVQVIGSDEVFNCVQGNSNVGYSRDLFGHDRRARRLASYAASFGNTSASKLASTGITEEVAHDLARFDHLSVRDEHSQDLVRHLTGRSAEIHVDPVIAHPFMSHEERIPRHRLHQQPYFIVYGYSGRLSQLENRQLRAHADSHGASILAFGGVQECADRFVDCDPFELLAYFRDSLGVVTDTFHGSIFSIINKKPFATIVRQSVGNAYGNEEKLGYLLRTFGLEDRRTDRSRNMPEILGTLPDFQHVDAVLDRERRRTNSYLRRVLS